MKKSSIYFLLLITALITACNGSPTQSSVFTTETGLLDEDGNIVSEDKYVYTNTIYFNAHSNGNIPIWSTNYKYITITNTLEVPAKIPDPNYSWDYYRIWVPFAVKNSDGYNSYAVNYKDSETLKRLWLEQLQRKGETDGKHFYIRNGNNTKSIESFQGEREYYFFNSSGDMYYKKLNLKIKEFVGAIIVKLRKGTLDGVYTVGGLYRIYLTRDEYMAIAKTNNDNQAFRKVMSPDYYYHFSYDKGPLSGSWDEQGDMERQKGDLDVMVLNNGYKYNNDREFGFDSYLYYGANVRNDENIPFFTNENVYLGARPEYTTLKLDFTINYSDRTQNKDGQYPIKTSFKDYNFAFLPGFYPTGPIPISR